MPADLDNCSTVNDYTASGDSSSGNQIAPPKPNVKKKRNLPGMPGRTKHELLSHFLVVFQENDAILMVDFLFL